MPIAVASIPEPSGSGSLWTTVNVDSSGMRRLGPGVNVSSAAFLKAICYVNTGGVDNIVITLAMLLGFR